jgi:hypothetical protein
MSQYTVLSSLNMSYWETVGNINVVLLDERWPRDIPIHLYYDNLDIKTIPERKTLSPRLSWVNFYKLCPEYLEFADKWKDNIKANGGPEKDFRYNAVKFAHKTFAIWHQAKQVTTGWLIWIDCDITTINQVDVPFLQTVCPENKMVSYIGRPNRYSECGWMAFNMNHPEIRRWMSEWETMYTSGSFINEKQTHDSWLFDQLRLKWDQPLFFDLNSVEPSDSNPLGNSLLQHHFHHEKGDNKQKQLHSMLRKRRLAQLKTPGRPSVK